MSDSKILGETGKPRASSLLRNSLYNVGGQAVRAAVAVLTIPFLIRFLGIREFGVWSLAYAVLALMTMGEAGISVAATVFLSKDLAEDDAAEASRSLTCILLFALTLSVVFGFLLWFLGPGAVRALAAFGSAERTEAGRALRIASLAVSVFILERALVGVEQALDRYAAINGLETARSLLTNVGLAVVAWFGGRAVAMMKWQVVACGVLLTAHCCFVSRLLRGKRLSFAWSGAKARRIFRFSVAAWASVLGSAAFSECDRLIVGGILGAPSLGIYSVITSVVSRINSFSGTAVQPLVPSLSRDAARTVPAEARVRQAAHLNALIAVEGGIFLYVLADWVMRVMVPGAAAPRDILGLQIAAIIYALYSLNAPGYFILFSVGEARKNAIVVLTSAVVSLGSILLGARYLGLLGSLAGNAGYWGTLLMIPFGLGRVGVALRRYLAWIAFPLVGLVAALFVGLVLQEHFWWRVAFVAAQGGLLMFWFFREQSGVARSKLGWRRVAEG